MFIQEVFVEMVLSFQSTSMCDVLSDYETSMESEGVDFCKRQSQKIN
jgi:hypothetical protein